MTPLIPLSESGSDGRQLTLPPYIDSRCRLSSFDSSKWIILTCTLCQKSSNRNQSTPCNPGRNRTYDLLVKSQVLCQLSYRIIIGCVRLHFNLFNYVEHNDSRMNRRAVLFPSSTTKYIYYEILFIKVNVFLFVTKWVGSWTTAITLTFVRTIGCACVLFTTIFTITMQRH